jgi:hypothetical protein
MNDLIKSYQTFTATCKVLVSIDWFGNYTIQKITDKEIKYIGQSLNVDQYFKRFIEVVKDNVLKNVSNINCIKWNIKGFDEGISLHLLVREIGKIIEKYLKIELTQKYPQFGHQINKKSINFNKTLVVEIYNNDKLIFLSNISVESFI